MRSLKFISFFMSMFGCGLMNLYAQEVLTGIRSNPVLWDVNKTQIDFSHESNVPTSNSPQSKQAALDTLILPFFEDFVNASQYPDQSKWLDSFVYINNGFALNPISVGVATFDGLGKDGKAYTRGKTARGRADMLTSRPIQLLYPELDSIYLSFFYQAQGNGRAPANGDSLILEFWSVIDSTWNQIWFANGSAVMPFKQVLIPVRDEKYLQKGFQFRFRNLADLSGNTDHWNIDYIKLNRNRSAADTNVYDVAFNSLPSGLLKNYTNMPYNQFNSSELISDSTSHFCFIKNNSQVQQTLNFKYNCVEEESLTPVSAQQRGVQIPSRTSQKESMSAFPINFGEKKFRLKSTYALSTDINDYSKQNDTVIGYNTFSNFYSYDDGSPEDGYGLTVLGASLAYKFGIRTEDTLTSVRMMFTEIGEDVSKLLFALTIWDQDKNTLQPGKIIYQKFSQTPQYAYGINGFSDYFLDSILLVKDTIYIGWVQSTNKPLSVGFDRSKNNNDKLFYQIDNRGWLQSSLGGTLMIRPVFGDYNNKTFVKENSSRLKSVNVYPNPVKDRIHIDLKNISISKIQIYNGMGSLVQELSYDKDIDVSQLNSGFYILQLIDENGNRIAQGKFIK